jgi:hypothetical protein
LIEHPHQERRDRLKRCVKAASKSNFISISYMADGNRKYLYSSETATTNIMILTPMPSLSMYLSAVWWSSHRTNSYANTKSYTLLAQTRSIYNCETVTAGEAVQHLHLNYLGFSVRYRIESLAVAIPE